jgi:hypothetical protein
MSKSKNKETTFFGRLFIFVGYIMLAAVAMAAIKFLADIFPISLPSTHSPEAPIAIYLVDSCVKFLYITIPINIFCAAALWFIYAGVSVITDDFLPKIEYRSVFFAFFVFILSMFAMTLLDFQRPTASNPFTCMVLLSTFFALLILVTLEIRRRKRSTKGKQ